MLSSFARDYLLSADPCTAMVFVWSSLIDGDLAYIVVQVATNDLIILVVFTPSVVLFVAILLLGGILTRIIITRNKDKEYF